jgi:hypothetical protein
VPASLAPVHAAPALEALLPHVLNGTTLSSQSATGATALGTDPSSQALTKTLASLGKKPADLLIAEAYDPSGNIALWVIGFQAGGVAGTTLRQAILDSWLAAAPSNVKTTTVTISGKQVIKVDYGDGGVLDYLYEHGESVFDVATADASLAATALGQLP